LTTYVLVKFYVHLEKVITAAIDGYYTRERRLAGHKQERSMETEA